MMAPTPPPAPAASAEDAAALKVQAAPQVQTRVIVHTAYLSLIVNDVAGAVDWTASLA